jgi:hypothetical protein
VEATWAGSAGEDRMRTAGVGEAGTRGRGRSCTGELQQPSGRCGQVRRLSTLPEVSSILQQLGSQNPSSGAFYSGHRCMSVPHANVGEAGTALKQ